jgi:DNA polymerase I-like protein with 3'-5' exonuclease and polymerase domains
MATDWIHSKYGKKSWSARIIKEGIERQAMNFPIQGGAHEAFEAGCLKLVRKFKEAGLSPRTRIILSNHDGILGECLPSEMELIKKLIPEAMIKTYNAGTKWELTTKIEVGFYKERWYGEEIA